MKKIAFAILSFLGSVQSPGQMLPLSDQYLDNMLAINPAYAGCDDALSATALYRNQWVGFDDAPKSETFSLHAPVNNDRIGLGMIISHNSIGIYKRNDLMGNYAYRRELFNGKLALGLGFGVTFYQNDWNDLEVADAGDELLVNNPTSSVLPSFSIGAYYYAKEYFIGFSLPFFLSHVVDDSNGKYRIKNDFSAYNYILAAGGSLPLGQQVKLIPSLLLKYLPDHPVQLDYTIQISLKDRIRTGIGYRNKNTLMALLQCRFNYQLRMLYSYAFDFGNLGGYKNGSHEIGLNYIFSYSHRAAGPRQF
jgi:type IX secretion system PorP/SprF family membrane protein